MRRHSLAIIGMLLALASSLQAQSTSTKKPFKEEELAALLAPIALYPDKVIAQILMASTYPLEVVEANRWVQQNANLKGDALVKEAEKQDWDPSVQSLVSLPDVLKSMDTKIDWTQKVGDAFLAQQKEVMDMIQKLRTKAKDEGNLQSSEQLKVTTEPAAAAAPAASTAAAAPQVIVIESAQPNTVYVPTYPPTVYGSWGYPAYPPYTMPPPPGYPGSGFWLGVGVTVAVWNNNWNNYPNWGGGSINIGEINIGNTGNINRGNINGGGSWQHNPQHRRGTEYRDSGTASKYNRGSNTNASSRDSYRGRDTSSPSASTRDAGSSNRSSASPSTSNRSSATPSTSNRSSASPSTSNRSSGSAFGGMSSGSSASRSSSRGGASRGGGGGRRR